MEKKHEIIRNYFEKKGVGCRERSISEYRFHGRFSANARLQDCEVCLVPCESCFEVTLILPLRVRRSESYEISRELALLNEELPGYVGYTIDSLNGAILFRTRIEVSEAPEELEGMLQKVMDMAEEDLETIVEELAKAKKAADDTRDEAPDAKEEESRAEPSIASRVLSFLGVVSNTDEED